MVADTLKASDAVPMAGTEDRPAMVAAARMMEFMEPRSNLFQSALWSAMMACISALSATVSATAYILDRVAESSSSRAIVRPLRPVGRI